MLKKREKFLTQNEFKKLGLDNVSVITADMLDGYTSIVDYAFYNCTHLSSITIPDSIINIGYAAFMNCSGLTSVTIQEGVTNIGGCAFWGCTRLASVVIPNSVTCIGMDAFYKCCSLTMVTIGDKIYEKQTITNSNCKAYKAFNANMRCRDFQYKEGKTFKINGKPVLCKYGFHACLSLANIFTYYFGRLGKDIVIYEVELEGVSDERCDDSKVVAKKITIGKRIL